MAVSISENGWGAGWHFQQLRVGLFEITVPFSIPSLGPWDRSVHDAIPTVLCDSWTVQNVLFKHSHAGHRTIKTRKVWSKNHATDPCLTTPILGDSVDLLYGSTIANAFIQKKQAVKNLLRKSHVRCKVVSSTLVENLCGCDWTSHLPYGEVDTGIPVVRGAEVVKHKLLYKLKLLLDVPLKQLFFEWVGSIYIYMYYTHTYIYI